MTTGRINQVAIGIAETVRDDSGDRPTDVHNPHHHSPNGRDRSPRPTKLLSVRLPSTHLEVGITKTVEVQVP